MGNKPYQIDPRIVQLHENKGKLDKWGQEKAAALCESYHRFRGKFTEKQWNFVQSLLDKATGGNVMQMPLRSVTDLSSGNVPVPVDLWEIHGFAKVEEMLYAARAKVTYPRIKIAVNPRDEIAITPSQSVRGVNVKWNKEFVGVVRNERFQLRNGPTENTKLITEMLKAFAVNPTEMAHRHGKNTGHCCFCSLLLTDERSVKVGYGPICAENYGLPWGEGFDVKEMSETYGSFEVINTNTNGAGK